MTADGCDPPSGLPMTSVLGKVAAILDALAGSGGRMGLSELARTSGVAKPTAHRICDDLVTWGVVERVGDAFRLGPRLFELGQRVPSRRWLRETALPYLEDLSISTRQTVHLAVAEGDDVFYVEKLAGRQAIPTPSEVAGRMPLHCTATGKCLLAFGPAELVTRAIERGLPPRTSRSISDPGVLLEQLALVRRQRVAVERGEFVEGFGSVAAPVFGALGHLLGAMAVTAPEDSLHQADVVGLVRAAAEETSVRLGAWITPDRPAPGARGPVRARGSDRCADRVR